MKRARLVLLALLIFPSIVFGANGQPVLLDFHADWCGPCRQMRPTVQRLEDAGYPVRSINVDQSKDLARQYQVSDIPAFIIVDQDGRELARTTGVQRATDLANLYNNACTKARPAAAIAGDEVNEPAADVESAEPSRPPYPWATTVRIKIKGRMSTGFGSGTIIHSTEKETIILTCAHIFDMEGRRVPPAQFPRQVLVDLFDGQLHGTRPAMVHPLEMDIEGKALAYDFDSDLGLIRIRPGRPLKFSPVVPAEWQPRLGEKMDTVGCPEGQNATAWTTRITNPSLKASIGRSKGYEAIECLYAPIQGRSGGGLFTRDGYLAGVCDFAEPTGGHGLYASPRAIHRFLDRNQLTFCYNPAVRKPDTLLAAAGTTAGRASEPTKVRAQGPESIPMPEPDRLGVRLAPVVQASSHPDRGAWQASGGAPASKPVPTDLEVNSRLAANDPTTPATEAVSRITKPSAPRAPGGWRAARPSTARK